MGPTIQRMYTQNPEDGHPPSQGCSPTIPKMLTHHPKDAHPPSPGCSPIIPRLLTHHPKDGHQLFGHPLTIPHPKNSMVIFRCSGNNSLPQLLLTLLCSYTPN